MDLTNPDPLGIGLRSRAAQAKTRRNPTGLGSMGPLGDPQWDAFFQALDENGVDRLADNSVGVKRGMFPQGPPRASTYDPATQSSAVDVSPSNQLGTNVDDMMAGLDRAIGGGSVDDAFAIRKSPMRGRLRVQTQRGTSGNNQTQRA